MDVGIPFCIFLDRHAVANAAEDILELVAPSNAVWVVEEADLAESAAETAMQNILQWIKGFTTSGSGGSSVTPQKYQTGDGSIGGTVERNNTTVATTGTAVTLPCKGFDNRNGFLWVPKPKYPIVLSPSERLVLRQPVGPGATWTVAGFVNVRQIGG